MKSGEGGARPSAAAGGRAGGRRPLLESGPSRPGGGGRGVGGLAGYRLGQGPGPTPGCRPRGLRRGGRRGWRGQKRALAAAGNAVLGTRGAARRCRRRRPPHPAHARRPGRHEGAPGSAARAGEQRRQQGPADGGGAGRGRSPYAGCAPGGAPLGTPPPSLQIGGGRQRARGGPREREWAWPIAIGGEGGRRLKRWAGGSTNCTGAARGQKHVRTEGCKRACAAPRGAPPKGQRARGRRARARGIGTEAVGRTGSKMVKQTGVGVTSGAAPLELLSRGRLMGAGQRGAEPGGVDGPGSQKEGRRRRRVARRVAPARAPSRCRVWFRMRDPARQAGCEWFAM
jgi:hypothetical protein